MGKRIRCFMLERGYEFTAAAGSIAAPGYHGFLRNGYLEEC